jgi:hypothetical protein
VSVAILLPLMSARAHTHALKAEVHVRVCTMYLHMTYVSAVRVCVCMQNGGRSITIRVSMAKPRTKVGIKCSRPNEQKQKLGGRLEGNT